MQTKTIYTLLVNFLFFVVALICQDRFLRLMYNSRKQNELSRAQDEIRSLLKFKEIPVETSFEEIIQEDKWKRIKENIESSGRYCVSENVRH